jgi:hypothetical protein
VAGLACATHKQRSYRVTAVLANHGGRGPVEIDGRDIAHLR